ncbi:MAG TPA: GGDEF domain-containing protein, partial [Burkholderiaceae bacterium]|nr:GGDEF domain-containing protein [Burkholderiaceae bacterium]
VWAGVALVAWAASAHFNVANSIADFTHRHEDWQLDEVFTLIVFLSLAAFVTSFCQSRRHFKKRQAAEREAFTAARRDVLTGLPNRRMFLELAGNALGEAWRGGRTCSVLFVDLDGFKPVNDTYGHATGDALLIEVGTRLQQSANGLVARLGGDEFAILLTGPERDDADPLAVAKRVLVELQRPFEIAGNEVSIGASIGIATGPGSGRRAEDLTDAADRAMYMAKRAGRGTIRVFEAQRPIEEAQLLAA